MKYTKNISFPEARQLVKQCRSEQSKPFTASFADVTAPQKDNCNTCTILAKLIITKFPEMAKDLKDILPKSTFSALSLGKSSASSEKLPNTAQTVKVNSPAPSKFSSVTTFNPKPAKPSQDTPKIVPQPRTRVQLGKQRLPSASTYSTMSKRSLKPVYLTRRSQNSLILTSQ